MTKDSFGKQAKINSPMQTRTPKRELAPVVLFVYNRYSHTLKCIETLRKNDLAGQIRLIVFSDGAKDEYDNQETLKVHKIRELLRSLEGFAEVKVIERPVNFGLARNIIDGVSSVLREHESVIVLEDDIETSPGFLRYMNDALEFYRNEPRVMHVSGYMFPVKGKLPPTFFYNTASCWGWGTWRDRWVTAEWDAKVLCEQVEESGRIADFNIGNTYPFFDHLRKNSTGEMRTWAVRWYANIFLKGGLALHPFPSLTQNIGMDGQGTHCGVTDKYSWSELADFISVKSIELRESKKCISLMKQFNAPKVRRFRLNTGILSLVHRIFRWCTVLIRRTP